MAEMMKQMENMAEGGDFQNVLEGMMEQLMSRDILYEPMLDLKQKVTNSTLTCDGHRYKEEIDLDHFIHTLASHLSIIVSPMAQGQ